MKNPKILLTILAAIIIVLIIFLISSYFKKPSSPEGGNNISPSESNNGLQNAQTTSISSVFPIQNTEISYLPIQQIRISSGKALDPDTVSIKSSPFVPVKVSVSNIDSRILIISPEPAWKPGITTITVNSESKFGLKILSSNFVYRIKTAYPENPPADSAEYLE